MKQLKFGFSLLMLGSIFAATIGIIAIVILSIFGNFTGNPLDYARITAVDYTAKVVDEPDSDGKVIITERLTFDIHAASKDNLFWELWRDLPEEYIDGVKLDYKINSVKQILRDGTEVIYQESPKLYWDDYDYINTYGGLGPEKWYYSEGPYDETYRQYECLLLYVDGLYREEAVFEIEYEMSNASLRYNDCSELYLTLYSESDTKYLEFFKGQILIPSEIMPQKGNYDAHTYGTNSHSFPFTESDSMNPGYHTFSFQLDQSQLKFKPYNQYIEFTLVSHGDDKHSFTKYASLNTYYYDDVLSELREEQDAYDNLPKDFHSRKIIVLLLSLAASFFTLILVFTTDKRMHKKHIFYTPTSSTYNYRDIPNELDPCFAAALVFCKQKKTNHIQDGYSAVMLSLVHKGYIELGRINSGREWVFENIKIIVKYQPVSDTTPADSELPLPDFTEFPPLSPSEEQYFNLIIRHSRGKEITLATFQSRTASDFENTNSFVENIESLITGIGVYGGYFQKANYQQPRQQVQRRAHKLIITGLLFLTLGNFILSMTRFNLAFGSFFILGICFIGSGIYLRKLSREYILLTQFGEDEYARWRGLYHYLNSDALMKERTVIDLYSWEQYLIYATAFGISEKVSSALNVEGLELHASPVLRNHYYRSRHYHSHSRSFRSATRRASFTSRSGGHGGYGGGGRGGGGGGGGH